MKQDITSIRALPRQVVRCLASLFTPSDVARIARVGLDTQRDWRRRNLLPSLHGQTFRADVFDIARYTALRLLSVRSGLVLAAPIAKEAGDGIASFVLRWIDAYEGDISVVGAWDREAFERGKRISNRMREVFATALTAGAMMQASDQIEREEGGPGFNAVHWLRANIMQARGIGTEQRRFLIWWADGSYEFVDDVTRAFNSGLSSDPRFDGLPLVADLEALASGIIERAGGRAFYHVEVDPVGDSQ